MHKWNIIFASVNLCWRFIKWILNNILLPNEMKLIEATSEIIKERKRKSHAGYAFGEGPAKALNYTGSCESFGLETKNMTIMQDGLNGAKAMK